MKRPEQIPQISSSEEESIPVSESLVAAMIPSEPEEPSPVTLEEEEIISAIPESEEPETQKRQMPERKAILPETEREAKINQMLRELEKNQQDAKEIVGQEVSWETASPIIKRFHEQGKNMERMLQEVTREIQEAEERQEETTSLRAEQRTLREAIEQLLEERDNLKARIPQEAAEDTADPYQAEKNILARIRAQLNKGALNERMRAQEADKLRHRAQQIEQQEIEGTEEKQQRERVLEKIYQIIQRLKPSEPLTVSKKNAAETRLHQQMEEAAERVRRTYGQEPEVALENAATLQHSKKLANFLRGLVGETDPLDEWEALSERVRKQEEARTAKEIAEPASSKKQQAA